MLANAYYLDVGIAKLVSGPVTRVRAVSSATVSTATVIDGAVNGVGTAPRGRWRPARGLQTGLRAQLRARHRARHGAAASVLFVRRGVVADFPILTTLIVLPCDRRADHAC